MLCKDGKLKNFKNEFCKFYVGRTYTLPDGSIVNEHFCINGAMTELGETFETPNLVSLEGKLIKSCNLYTPYQTKRHRKKKKKEVKIEVVNAK